MKEVIFVGASAVVLCIVTIWQAYQKYLSDETAKLEKLNADAERIKASNSQREAINYLKLLNNKNTEFQALQNANLEKSEKIIQDQAETLRNVVGYGVPEIIIGGSITNSYVIKIQNHSNYPMYDMQIQQINLTKLSDGELINVGGTECVNDELYNQSQFIYVIPFALIAKKIFRLPINLEKSLETEFIVYKISCRHGTYFQYCAIKNIPENNLIHYRYILYKLVGDNYDEIQTNLTHEDRLYFNTKCPFYKKDIAVFTRQ